MSGVTTMSTLPPTADELADLVLPLDGPYTPDRVIEAARSVRELVRRLNHATFHAAALRYPPQLHRTVGALKAAVYELEQAFAQLATRLEAFAADPRVEHDSGDDPWADCGEAAHYLRQAAGELRAVTEPLERVTSRTYHLGYDTTTRRTGPAGFPPPTAPDVVHDGQTRPPAVGPDPGVGHTSTRPGRGR
jgi:hypothetical protein